jgi:hypothetical protein
VVNMSLRWGLDRWRGRVDEVRKKRIKSPG